MLKQRGGSLDKMFDISKDFRYRLVKSEAGEFLLSNYSNSFTTITGMSDKEADNMPWRSLVHGDDMLKVEKHFKRVLDGLPNTEQYRIKSADGGFVTVIDYAKPVWNSEKTSVDEIKGSISMEISSESKTNRVQV